MKLKPHKIYAETLDPKALSQFYDAMKCEFVVKGALMPDAHLGYSIPIGAVVATEGMIVPAWVGYDIGCVDKDTEYLSPHGWVKISDYDGGKVAQHNPHSTEKYNSNFVTPEKYIIEPCEEFIKIITKYGLDQMISADHKCLVYDDNNKHSDISALDLYSNHTNTINGYRKKINTSFMMDIDSRIDMHDDILRVFVMYCADGHKEKNKALLSFKKERKITRAKTLLDNANIKYDVVVGKHDITTIKFYFPEHSSHLLSNKLLTMWGSSHDQLAVIADEVLHWDGNIDDKCFYTRKEAEADFINYVFSATGNRSVKRYDYKDGVKDYRVYRHKNTLVGMNSTTKELNVLKVPSEDGLKYCFTVPSGYLILRRNGKVFITGNCGMCALKTTFKIDDIRQHAQAIFDGIYRRIPVGANHNDRFTTWKEAESLPSTKVLKDLYDKNGGRQLGSLGSGNHFVEIGHDEKDNIWIVIHSGSRNLGHRIATHYMKLASDSNKAKEGNYPLDVTSVEGENYIKDLNFCLEFALQNRKVMIERIVRVIKETCEGDGNMRTIINRNHNHAQLTEGMWIHRKGATHAEAGMKGVIPGNMRDGSFIVEGKGHPDSLYSSSHGAGRVLSRRQAKENIDMEDFVEAMEGITAKVVNATIDESPFAYKDIFQVMREQEDLVDIKHHVKPIINIKA